MTENHINLDQYEDVTLGHLRRAARDARIHAEAAHRVATERYEETMDEVTEAQQYERMIDEVIRRHAASQNGAPARVKIAGGNLREVLIINFADQHGTIQGIEATSGLMDLGYYANRETADGAVYTTLGKSPFQKVQKGVYRIATNHPDWVRLRKKNAQQPLRRLPPSQQAELDVVADVARKQDGHIRFSQAKKALADSGLFKNEWGVNFAVSRVLSHSGRFQRIERGLYRLVEEETPPGRGSQTVYLSAVR